MGHRRGLLGQVCLTTPQAEIAKKPALICARIAQIAQIAQCQELFTEQPLSVKTLEILFAGILNSKSFRTVSAPHNSLSYRSRCCISVMCLVSLLPVFLLCCLPGSQPDLQVESRLAKRATATVYCSPGCYLVASSKPKLLSVGVRMRSLANLSTTASLLLLRFDAYMPCRMAGAKPPSRPRCSSGRDGGLAVCQRWHCSGHSLWSLARWTQPLEPGAVDTAFGA